jgi:hypothetical protein
MEYVDQREMRVAEWRGADVGTIVRLISTDVQERKENGRVCLLNREK